jgi:quercetin dioxygenase-like cupin family protein
MFKPMSETEPHPVVRHAEAVDYGTVDLADGLHKGVVLGDEHGTPNFNMRRFVLDPGARVPRHTNAVEHEQYVIEGEYVVGIGDDRYTVSAGDSLLIPAGVEHWYHNESDEQGSFLCLVPNTADEITVTE